MAIVPIFRKDEEKVKVLEAANRIANELREDGLTVELDDRDGMKPGAKYYEWERKGVPVRIEIGPRDIDDNAVMIKRRIAEIDERGKPKKEKLPMENLGVSIGKVLDEFQTFLFDRAKQRLDDMTMTVHTWEEFVDVLKDGNSRFVYAHWDGTTETELAIKDATKATTRCLPIDGYGLAL